MKKAPVDYAEFGVARLRRQLLKARDAREELIRRALRDVADTAGALVFASTNIPGKDKNPEGLDRIFAATIERLRAAEHGAAPLGLPASVVVAEGRDAAGPFALLASSMTAAAAKKQAVALEESLPAARLLDLDVYDTSGRQADRASLGLPERRCLVCQEPARECIRANRHDSAQLEAAVRALLA